jgi:hypothetical protein
MVAQTKDGFMNNAWGKSFSEMHEKFDLQPTLTRGDERQYSSNVRVLGGAEIADCEFEFNRDRFCGVIITTTGRENSRLLLAYLKSEYGTGHRENAFACQWFARDTHIAYDEATPGDAYVYWYSLSLQEK